MSNISFTQGRAVQPAYTPTQNAIIAVEDGGNTRFPTIDEISTLLTGNTVINNITDTYRYVVLTPSGLTNDRVLINTGVCAWGSPESDPYGVWSGVNPTRVTVPSSYTKARLTVNFILPDIASKNITRITIMKNGTSKVAEEVYGSGKGSSFLTSRVIPVVPGDYFEVDTAGSTYGEITSYFQIEFLEMIV